MKNSKLTREALCSFVVIALTVLGIILFALGFSTGYYTFGQLNSNAVLAAAIAAAVVACAAVFLRNRLDKQWWPKLLSFGVTALLALAAMLLIGDRVEGIGTCILTDYDSGHGGEEAIYMSLGASIAWLCAMVFNIIGSFGKDEPVSKGGKAGLPAVGTLLLLAILIPSLALGGVFAPKAASGSAGGNGGSTAGTYTTTFTGAEGNVELVQDYQFQCGSLLGLMKADSRLTLTLTLTLNADGTYALLSDAYCIEAGKRAVIGDDTGLGMISKLTAEGSYTVNEDGTVTTSPASHAVFELALDTYSSQMRGPAQYKVGELDADGTYDSAEHPAVLDAVPETVWTLGDGTIEAYGKPVAGVGTYTTTFTGAEGNVDLVQDVQFQCGSLLGLMKADSRLTLTLTLTLNPDGSYALLSDAYCIEAGKRAVIGDDTGLGMISTMNAEGTYVFNEDGTVTTSPASHAVFELALDTYSSQMRGPAQYKIGDLDADGTYDSAEHPAVLDAVPEATWTLGADGSIAAYQVAEAEEEPVETEAPAAAPTAECVEIVSDDGGTTMTFYADGTYRFFFESYSIEDLGTYTYENGVLTLKNANGAQTAAEGDPIKLHYICSVSDQLTGDYTIPAETFAFAAAEETPAAGSAEVQSVTIVSDDEGTKMTFNSDGTYRFDFESYSIVDEGTYTYEGGVLTVKDVNGVEYTAEGDPIHLHYGYSGAPDQLTGEYTIPAETFVFAPAAAEEEAEELHSLTVPSDDRGTSMTFNSDGSYRFWFAAYSIEDLGTWQIADGVLSLTDVNGVEYTAEGAPYKLHYGYSGAPDQLTGDYTIPVGVFPFPTSGTSVPSDDFGTGMTFFADGTYLFTFDSYSISDAGTWSFESGVLTVKDVNGVEYTAEGETLHLHYGYSGAPEQLTGEFTIDPVIFSQE